MFGELADQLRDWVMQFDPRLGVAILSAAPVSEFRGGVPYGIIVAKMSLWEVLPIAIAACMVPSIPIYFCFNWFMRLLVDKPVVGRCCRWALSHAEHKSERVRRWGVPGLILFAGIPAPGFGVWTAAAAAAVLGIPFWRAMISMLIGVAAGSLLVGGLTAGGVHIFG